MIASDAVATAEIKEMRNTSRSVLLAAVLVLYGIVAWFMGAEHVRTLERERLLNDVNALKVQVGIVQDSLARMGPDLDKLKTDSAMNAHGVEDAAGQVELLKIRLENIKRDLALALDRKNRTEK